MSETVAPDLREARVEERVVQGVDVVIRHPCMVQTGLDFVDFPTITLALSHPDTAIVTGDFQLHRQVRFVAFD